MRALSGWLASYEILGGVRCVLDMKIIMDLDGHLCI